MVVWFTIPGLPLSPRRSQGPCPSRSPWSSRWLLWALFSSSALAGGSSEVRPRLEIGGSFKSIVGYQGLRHVGLFSRSDAAFAEERFRLDSTLVWGDWRLEISPETSVVFQTPLGNSAALPSALPRPKWDLSYVFADTPSVRGTTRLDRANLKWNRGVFSAIVGKQVVSIGVGHLFSAVSQTPRQPFVIVDPEYPIAEDALTLQWDGALSVEARYLPKNPGQRSDSFHFRAKGSKSGYDLALTAGRSDDKPFVGVEATGGIGDALLRGELVLYDKSGTTVGQGLLGLDRAFSAKWSGELELFYAGGLSHRSSPYRGDWYAGARVRGELSDRWKMSAAVLAAFNDFSALLHLSLWYSLSTNLEIGLGQFFGAGGPTSEFAGRSPLAPGIELGLPNLTYGLIRFYF